MCRVSGIRTQRLPLGCSTTKLTPNPRRARFRPTGGTRGPLRLIRPLQRYDTSAPDWIRTSDLEFRKLLLYPLSYGSKPSPWSPHTGGGRLDGLCRWLKARGQSGSTTSARTRQPRSIRDRARTGGLQLERMVSFANSSTRTGAEFSTHDQASFDGVPATLPEATVLPVRFERTLNSS